MIFIMRLYIIANSNSPPIAAGCQPFLVTSGGTAVLLGAKRSPPARVASPQGTAPR